MSQFILKKKNHSFAEFLDKISDPYNKTTQKFYFFLKPQTGKKEKKKISRKLKN